MKALRFLLPTVVAAVVVSSLSFAQSTAAEKDINAVQEFVKAKRTVNVRDKGGELSLSGDVRFEYQSVTESRAGTKQVGSSGVASAANHSYDVEVDLMLDYKTEDTWAGIKLEFDNNAGHYYTPMGTSNIGQANSVRLERAIIGYNIMEEDAARLDVEVGRRHLYEVMESKIQFASVADSLRMKYSNSFADVGAFYITAGAMIIDDRIDHYGWYTEAGLMDIADSGLYTKYSYIDWDNTGVDTAGVANVTTTPRTFRSRNSQLTVGYKFQPEALENDLKLYGAYLMNHAAKKIAFTNNKKKNKAWYLGAVVGKNEMAGDYSVEARYESVGAQAVSDIDVLGIGRGNAQGTSFVGTGWGNANYKGYALEGAYNITDNLLFTMEYESSNAQDKKIPSSGDGRNSYHKFELEVIYAF